MGVHPSAGLTVASTIEAYLARLPLAAGERQALLARAAGSRDAAEGLARVHAAMAGAQPSASPAFDSIAARLRMALGTHGVPVEPAAQVDVHGHARLVTTPAFHRTSMAPREWLRNPFGRSTPSATGPYRPRLPRAEWARSAALRRSVLLLLVLAQTAGATYAMSEVLPYKGTRPLEVAVLAVFSILF